MNVVRFNNEDVIATSACTKDQAIFSFRASQSVTNGYVAETENTITTGSKITLAGTTYQLNARTYPGQTGYSVCGENSTTMASIASFNTSTNGGVYHLVNGVYVYCVDGYND